MINTEICLFSFAVRQSSCLVRLCTLPDASTCVPRGVDLLEAEQLNRVIDFYTHYVAMQ